MLLKASPFDNESKRLSYSLVVLSAGSRGRKQGTDLLIYPDRGRKVQTTQRRSEAAKL